MHHYDLCFACAIGDGMFGGLSPNDIGADGGEGKGDNESYFDFPML